MIANAAVDAPYWGDLLALLLFAALALQLLRSVRGATGMDKATAYFIAATAASSCWAGLRLLTQSWDGPWLAVMANVADALRYACWFSFLAWLLRGAAPAGAAIPIVKIPTAKIPTANTATAKAAAANPTGRYFSRMHALALTVAASAAGLDLLAGWGTGPGAALTKLGMAFSLALAVLGVLLVEQVIRNLGEDSWWSIKPVCIGLSGVFIYDIYVYSEALLFGRFDTDAWGMRGAIHALSTPLLFIASRRQSHWAGQVRLSRDAAFYSASLLLIGVYLLLVSGTGYYVRYFGGEWGRALQLALLVGGGLLLLLLAFSGTLRAWLRVFVGKNFFRYRFDYRHEWLRFTQALSGAASPQALGASIIRGLADMLESDGGGLWTTGQEEVEFAPTAVWNMARAVDVEPVASNFCAFMRSQGWIIDLDEYRDHPHRYADLVIPAWLRALPKVWLVVPLLVGDKLIGFVVLAQPRAAVKLDWEVLDLLKTASRQAAGFLAQQQATEALLEARKFDAFNRMSAFVVHDLKNIVTQLSLMMKNAKRLGHNPEFQRDMLDTVENSLDKMRQLMAQLREGERPAGVGAGVDLPPLLQRIAAAARSHGRQVELDLQSRLATRGHEDRLERVLGHIVQNALDATTQTGAQSGRVWVRLYQFSGSAVVEVGDDGVGMSPEFVQSRLFRPFNTTKHSGMGIGAYESFQYIKEIGGSIHVDSEEGKGTVIKVHLPLFVTQRASDLQAAP